MKKNKMFRFVAVVEQHANFDYSQSPRFSSLIVQPESAPNSRSPLSYLEKIQVLVTESLVNYLPEEKRFLIWLVDKDDKPLFFVTGLLDVRRGKLTKEDASELDKLLRPKITCEQQLFSRCIPYEGIGHLNFYVGQDRDESAMELAEGLTEDICNEFNEFSIDEADYTGDYLFVSVFVSDSLSFKIPWQKSEILRQDQIEFLRNEIEEYTTNFFDEFEVEDMRVDAVLV